jgi:anti-sigma-K factor RskA
MTFDEMQLIMQQILLSQRDLQESDIRIKALTESNARAIQAMLGQAAEDRLNREEEKLLRAEERAEHERRITRLEDISERIVRTQEGLMNLLGSLDEDRPTVLRKLNTIDNKVDTLLDRLPAN